MTEQTNKRINTMIEKTCYKYRNEMIILFRICFSVKELCNKYNLKKNLHRDFEIYFAYKNI